MEPSEVCGEIIAMFWFEIDQATKILFFLKSFPFTLSFPRAHNKYKCNIISWLVVVAQ